MMGNRTTCAVGALAIAVGLVASACSGSSDSGAQSTSAAATTTPQVSATAAAGSADLQSLLPAPANSQQTKGPDTIADNGIHMHYQITGSPKDVMDAYKTALEGKGWQVTTIVTSGGGGGGGGGATYTGTNGDAYGVFDGGGFNTTTYIDACTWPTRPANPNCSRGDR